jgi:hypothetical protein
MRAERLLCDSAQGEADELEVNSRAGFAVAQFAQWSSGTGPPKLLVGQRVIHSIFMAFHRRSWRDIQRGNFFAMTGRFVN